MIADNRKVFDKTDSSAVVDKNFDNIPYNFLNY